MFSYYLIFSNSPCKVARCSKSFKKYSVRDVWTELPLQQLNAGLQRAVSSVYAQLRNRHTNDFAKLFGRVKLTLGQPVNLPTDERVQAYNKDKADRESTRA